MASDLTKKIKQICIDKEMPLGTLGNLYGITSNSMYVKLSRGHLKYTEVEKIMDVLGCEIQFKDRKSGKVY